MKILILVYLLVMCGLVFLNQHIKGVSSRKVMISDDPVKVSIPQEIYQSLNEIKNFVDKDKKSEFYPVSYSFEFQEFYFQSGGMRKYTLLLKNNKWNLVVKDGANIVRTHVFPKKIFPVDIVEKKITNMINSTVKDIHTPRYICSILFHSDTHFEVFVKTKKPSAEDLEFSKRHQLFVMIDRCQFKFIDNEWKMVKDFEFRDVPEWVL